ncbi:MAG: hypothetical protein EAX96_09480 [Candidatus Lokiarchaeota archaeon]|nr:hypothetical protein [Candidatus Lokiarchaeota archaeon]
MSKIDLEFKINGQKMKLSFDEKVQVTKIKEILNCLNETTVSNQDQKPSLDENDIGNLSIIDKLKLLFKKLKKIGWFTSQHVKELYLHEFGEELKSSTVSTYLNRLYESSELSRRGSRSKREYFVGQIEEKALIQI